MVVAAFLWALPPAAFGAPARNPPNVVVTVKPLHSLVAAVMAGVAEPTLLISGADSPHTHSVRPSEARALERADLVFWVGPTLESSFAKPIAALVHGKVVSVLGAAGLHVLPVRPLMDLSAEPAAQPDADEVPGAPDPHVWLDPDSARTIVKQIAASLGASDPDHAKTYAANAGVLEARLADLDTELQEKLSPLSGKPFIAFHDAYHYLERRYGLSSAAAVTLSPERAPGARRISELRDFILAHGVRCVFTEPQFEPAIARTLVAGTQARIAVLDPEGAEIDPGPELYFTLMRSLADSLHGCLTGPGG